jgi:Protein of unknown function (DUF2934)
MHHKSAHQRKLKAQSQTDASKKYPEDTSNREQMIAVAAYFRAQHRGFHGGNSVDDWLAAEAEIDTMLGSHKSIH